MPLDWLFGSKKKAEQDPPPPTEEKQSTSGDDFVMLDSDATNAARGVNGGVYPQLPYALTINPAAPTGEPISGMVSDMTAIHHEVTTVQGFLNGVPFKLTTAEAFEDIDSATAYHLRASQLITHVSEGISTDRFAYDFQVEKSVLHEAGCRDLG